jgi:hypothetical protein
MQESSQLEDRKSIYQRLREAVLPVRPTDNAIVKLGKHTGFVLFMVMATLVSALLAIAVSFVL